MRFVLLLAVAAVFQNTVAEDRVPRPDPFAGWTVQGDRITGTGSRFMEGYSVDRRTGVVSGTGDRFGERWVPDGHGGYRQEGRAFGDGR